jgi:hypothetical protein
MGKEVKFCTRCGKRLVVKIIEANNNFDAVTGKAKRLRITQCPDYAPGTAYYYHWFEQIWLN